MNEELRKSFNKSITFSNNNNDFNKGINPISLLHKQKKLPTIIINSKNSDVLRLSSKNIIKSFNRQKSLTSKTLNNLFNRNLARSNYYIRKNSTNLLNTNIKFNNMNSYATINNSIIANKNSRKNSINYQSSDIFQNLTMNYNKTINTHPISIKKLKNPNDFDVSEEDRIFNQYKGKKTEKKIIKKGKPKIKIKLKKKRLNPFTSYDAALHKVYKQIPKIINKIEDTKKLKGIMSLQKYQNLLMDVGTKNLNRETREKLNNKFTSLRNFSYKPLNLLKESLETIETKEKKIIESINTQQNYYKRKMKENKYYTITSSRNIGFINLPNLKFHKIGNSKKKYKKKY